MADDEDYWNSTSVGHAFDFDDTEKSAGGGDVLRLFGVSNKSVSPGYDAEQSLREDTTAASDETRSLRSLDDFSTGSNVPIKTPLGRSTSLLNSGRSGAIETVQSAPSLIISPSKISRDSSEKSINQPLIHTVKTANSSSAENVASEASSLQRRESSSSSHSHLSAEVKYLKRNLEVSRKDQWTKISPKDMIWRIVRNKPYNLEHYRGLEEKVALLDHALNLHETTAILVAILHMKNTLSLNLFYDELSKKPDAVDQYVAYLKDDGRYQDCMEFLEALGRTDEAAALQFEFALLSDDITTKLRDLDLALKRQPAPHPTRSSDLPHIKKFKSLLEIQRPIEELDDRASKDPKDFIFSAHPRRSILGLSLLQTLLYCCMYHFDKPETSFCSPLFLRKTFAISEKQFLWTAVNALSRVQKWTELQTLLTDKTGWFGQPKPKAVIGFDRVVDILQRNGTPPDVLAYYLRLIDDPEMRLHYSVKCRCHSVAIDTFAALKDYVKLADYANQFEADSNEARYCQEVLQRAASR